MLGTMRALSEATGPRSRRPAPAGHGDRRRARRRARRCGSSTGYPVTVNADGAADLVHSTTRRPARPGPGAAGADPVMGAEDFSYVLQRVPGAMTFLGACPPGQDPEKAPANHSNRVVFDEDAMAVGVATHVATALAALAALAT